MIFNELKNIFKYLNFTAVMLFVYYLLLLKYLNSYGRIVHINQKSTIKTSSKPNACLFILIRNDELNKWIDTMKEFETNFNSKFNYPYIFTNDVPFTQEFKDTVLNLTKSKVEFGLVPKEHWSIPDWINMKKFNRLLNKTLKKMWSGTKISYHHMCRYYSGFVLNII